MIGQAFGHCRIVEQIGAGGMGDVYRATDTRLGRDVALKLLPDAFARDSECMARFQREAPFLASLNHPNIATIYGLEEPGRARAIAMELAEGPSLADRLLSGPTPLDEVLAVALQIAGALQAAREKGIIHRDLKPANVKAAPDGSELVTYSENTTHIQSRGVGIGIETDSDAGGDSDPDAKIRRPQSIFMHLGATPAHEGLPGRRSRAAGTADDIFVLYRRPLNAMAAIGLCLGAQLRHRIRRGALCYDYPHGDGRQRDHRRVERARGIETKASGKVKTVTAFHNHGKVCYSLPVVIIGGPEWRSR